MENFLKKYLEKARAENFAVGAFNLDSLETLKAVSLKAKELNSPVIVEVSPGEINYLGTRNVASLVDNAIRELDTPIFLNLDHAEDLDKIKECLDFGFSLVHFDGSKLSLDDNIFKAKEVVSWAHDKGILVEGEIDPIGGRFTDPEMGKRFVGETGVDIFAVSIGNDHGISDHEGIDLNHLEKIKQILPDQWFSLHGGSGIPAEQVKQAIGLGIVKVNINSEMRQAFKNGLDLTIPELAWYKITDKAIAQVGKVVEDKIKIFGSGGKI